MVLGIFFQAFSNTNFQFDTEKLIWRSYTTAGALSTTSRVEHIDKRKFAQTALDKNSETFVIHVAALEILIKMPIYPSRASQVQDNLTLATL